MNILDKSAINACTSCQLCAAVCAKNAISIVLNEDGFYRPALNESLCVDCGLCTKVCYKFDNNVRMSDEQSLKEKPLFSAWAKDDVVVKETTSGGIGDLLARTLLAEGYKVVGCSYNEDKTRAEHHIATNADELLAFRGSKYIQSFSFDALKEVVKNCKNEKYAVFGTGCQIYGLNKLASQRNVRDNFFFVDLYCHGCPSLHVWTKYQKYIKDKLKIDRFDKVEFRSKVRGWGAFYVVVVVVDGKIVFKSKPGEDCFYELFFSDQVLNDGCHECKLRSTLEYTDIRLGDFWGKKFLSNQRGVSGVSVATEKGMEVFQRIQNDIESAPAKYSDFLPFQHWGKIHHPKVAARTETLASLRNPNETIFDAVAAFRRNQSTKGKIKRHVKNVLYYFPTSFTMFLKRFM